MKRFALLVACGLTLVGKAFTQGADDPNEGARLVQTGPNSYDFSWYARDGWSYLGQHSEDLVSWYYFPDCLAGGEDDALTYSFGIEGPARYFVRLFHLEIPFSDDLDGDRVSNVIEISLGTDPLHYADADGDGMSDDWEVRFELDPNDSSDADDDPDEDGQTNLAEYLAGTFGTDPTGYYNAVSTTTLPRPEIISGNFKTAQPGQFAEQPLVIELRYGATPVPDSPVTFLVVGTDAGQISLTDDGVGLATSLTLRTGTDGRAQVYFRHPDAIPPLPTYRVIDARVGSAVPSGASIAARFNPLSRILYDYPAGTVGRNLCEAIDSRIAGTNSATAKAIFTTQDHNPPVGVPVYVRNTAAWCYDLRQAMTCISPWNTTGVHLFAGTAITAQHVINSAHYPLVVGDVIRFITADNVIVARFIRGKAQHPAYVGQADGYHNDLTVYTLDSPLPASITPCKMLPASYSDYLSYIEVARPPALLLDQDEKALIFDMMALGAFTSYTQADLLPARAAFWEGVVVGDSGNPAFFIINDSLVLLSTHTFSLDAGGTFVTPQISALNAMIATADAQANVEAGVPITGLQVQTIDLSGFDTFTPP